MQLKIKFISDFLRKSYCFKCDREFNNSLLKNLFFIHRCPYCKSFLLSVPLNITLSISFMVISIFLMIVFIFLFKLFK